MTDLQCPFCHTPAVWKTIPTPQANDGGMSTSDRLGCDNRECLFKPSAHYPRERWEPGKGHIPQDLRRQYEAAWQGRKL